MELRRIATCRHPERTALLKVFAEGGSAKVSSLEVYTLESAWGEK